MGASHGHPSSHEGAAEARAEPRKGQQNQHIQLDPIRNGTTSILRHTKNGPVKTADPLIHDIQGSKIPRKDLQLPDFLRTDDYEPKIELTNRTSDHADGGMSNRTSNHVLSEASSHSHIERDKSILKGAHGPPTMAATNHVPKEIPNHVSSSSNHISSAVSNHTVSNHIVPSTRNHTPRELSSDAAVFGRTSGLLITKKELELPEFLKVNGIDDTDSEQYNTRTPSNGNKPKGILVNKDNSLPDQDTNPYLRVSQLSLDDPLDIRPSKGAPHSAGQSLGGQHAFNGGQNYSIFEQGNSPNIRKYTSTGSLASFQDIKPPNGFNNQKDSNGNIDSAEEYTIDNSIRSVGQGKTKLRKNGVGNGNLTQHYTVDNSIQYAGNGPTYSDRNGILDTGEEYTVDNSIRSVSESARVPNSRAGFLAQRAKTPDFARASPTLRTNTNDARSPQQRVSNLNVYSLPRRNTDSVSESESDPSERTLALQRKQYRQKGQPALSEVELPGFLDESYDFSRTPSPAVGTKTPVRKDPSTSDYDNESDDFSARQTPLGHPSKQRTAAHRSNSLQMQLRERLQRFNHDTAKVSQGVLYPTGQNHLSRHSSFKSSCNDLPEELLFRIFSYLSTQDLCKASGVCRRWQDLCWDPILWNGIHINHYPHSNINRVLKCILTKLSEKTQGVCMTVHNIKLNGCELLSDKGLSHIGHYCIDLEHLDLIGCCCITSKGLHDILMNCQNLTRLNIAGCTCVNSISAVMMNGMSLGDNVSILHLRHLDLSDCMGFDDLGMRSVGISCALLEHLYLRRCPRVTDIGIQHIANHCLTLKELSVSDCYKIRDFSLREIAKRNSSLRYLSVAKCPVTDTGIKYIAKHCIKLRYLNVRGCDGVTDLGIAHIAQNCLKLRSLDIGKCGVTDNGLHIIGIHCPQLKKLSLKGCDRISEGGIRSIAVQCCSLQYLNVQECELSYETFVYIRQHCKNCIIEHTCPEFY